MPAYQLKQTGPHEETKKKSGKTEEKKEQLRKEIEEYTGPGSVYRRKLQRFMEKHGIWSIGELDYEWRLVFAGELHALAKPKYHSCYLKYFDHIKQYDMRKRGRPQVSRIPPRYPYEDRLLFLPYHPAQELVERLDTCPERPEWVWDFSKEAPGKMKRQIFDVLNYFLREDENGKLLREHLKGLWRFYRFCVEEQVEDIEQMAFDQSRKYRDQAVEAGQPKAAGILDQCWKILFLQAKAIHWDADVWYLERLSLQPERIDPSSPVVSLSFVEVTYDRNRQLLKKYMKYGLGLTDLSLRYLQAEMIDIRNFLKEIPQDACDMTETGFREYFQRLQEKRLEAETFNRKVMALQHFYGFLKAREYVGQIPFHGEYYLKKTLPLHHDRSVEEQVSDEILKKLHRFPEHLRLMYLHLWGIGLRISEVCSLKGDAYYIQGRDAWIQVYQVKLRTYKRIPIPEAVYRLMQVYLKKHGIEADSYVFQNKKGSAYQSMTFRKQMIKYCCELGIKDGEYLFRSHDYRHGVATRFYDSGVSIQGVRDYLGHAYEEMTRQYIDYMPERLDRASGEFFIKPGNSLMACLKGGGD